MAGERLTAMEHIVAGVGAAQLQGLASDALEAVDSATAGNEDGSRAKLDRAAALRAAIPEIAEHLSAVDQIHRDLGLTPPSLEFLSGLVPAEYPSDNPTPAAVGPNQDASMTSRQAPDVPAAAPETDRKRRERLEERYFEAAIARTRDGEHLVQTWDELLGFVYQDEFSEENRQRLTDELQSARRNLLTRLHGLLTTQDISDQILRIKAVLGRYRFYKDKPVTDIIASAGREIPSEKTTIEPNDDANQDLIANRLGNG